MKKIVCLLICLVFTLSLAVSLAEDKVSIGTITVNGAFDLKCALPKGYTVKPIKNNETQVQAWVVSEDPKAPVMQISVAFEEEYADVERMNDLDDEAFAALEKTFTDVDPMIDISYGDTGLGTRLLIARQNGEDTLNYIDFLSIYKGYMVEFVLSPGEGAEDKTLSDDQFQMCIDFLTEMDFVSLTETEASVEAEEAEEVETEN